jgi:hypothetical protein
MSYFKSNNFRARYYWKPRKKFLRREKRNHVHIVQALMYIKEKNKKECRCIAVIIVVSGIAKQQERLCTI